MRTAEIITEKLTQAFASASLREVRIDFRPHALDLRRNQDADSAPGFLEISLEEVHGA